MGPYEGWNGKIKGMLPEFTPTGTPAAIVSGTYPRAERGVIVQALKTNSASIFVGDVTVTEDNGLELAPGASLFLAVSSPKEVFAVCGTAAQKIRGMVL